LKASGWRPQWRFGGVSRGVIFTAPKPRLRVEPRPKSAAAERVRHMIPSIDVSKAL
jgi:hypothetical protein